MADDAATGTEGAPRQIPTGNPVPVVDDLRKVRDEKVAAARAARHTAVAAAQQATAAAEPEKPDEKPPAIEAKDAASKLGEKTADKPGAAATGDDKPDEQTAKGIAAIERREQRAREQIAADKVAWKQERDLEVAELKKLRDDLQGKATSLDDLKKLAKSRPLDALKALGIESEDDLEVVARQTYAVSKSGKADPKNKAYADQIAEKHGTASELADLRKELTDLREQLTTRERQTEAKQHAERWVEDGVKAAPKEPTHFGRALAANPTKARADLLATGQLMLREAIEENGGRYTPDLEPTHADVFARYEANKVAALKDDGFSDAEIAAMLKSAPAPTTKTAPPKTLDVGAARTTTDPAPQSRKEKVAMATSGLRKLWSQ